LPSASSGFPTPPPLPVPPLRAGGGGSSVPRGPVRAGQPVSLPLVGVVPAKMPGEAEPATAATASGDGITGTAWLDFP
ncbi:sugar ABC transporter permease, partial [Streptomyces sp. JAC25]